MAPEGGYTTLEAAGQEIRISSPSKVYVPPPGFVELDLAESAAAGS
jgi:hypothetical protein